MLFIYFFYKCRVLPSITVVFCQLFSIQQHAAVFFLWVWRVYIYLIAQFQHQHPTTPITFLSLAA